MSGHICGFSSLVVASHRGFQPPRNRSAFGILSTARNKRLSLSALNDRGPWASCVRRPGGRRWQGWSSRSAPRRVGPGDRRAHSHGRALRAAGLARSGALGAVGVGAVLRQEGGRDGARLLALAGVILWWPLSVLTLCLFLFLTCIYLLLQVLVEACGSRSPARGPCAGS